MKANKAEMTNEEALNLVITRLKLSSYSLTENLVIIDKLKEALVWLRKIEKR